MSVDIPDTFGINLDLIGPVELGRVTIDPVTLTPLTITPLTATLEGIPSTFTINIKELPLIDVNLRKVQLGVDPVSVSLQPVALNLAITELPKLRVHVPAHFRFGFSFFGREWAALELCGEAQVITEPYVPNPAERCGGSLRAPVDIVQGPPGTPSGLAPSISGPTAAADVAPSTVLAPAKGATPLGATPDVSAATGAPIS